MATEDARPSRLKHGRAGLQPGETARRAELGGPLLHETEPIVELYPSSRRPLGKCRSRRCGISPSK